MTQRSVLLLSSSRVFGYEYLEHAKDQITSFLKNAKTILFIPYAQIDHDKYTSLVESTLSPWGYKVEGLHTKTDPANAIRKAEAIFVGGGNTFVLLENLYKKGLIKPLQESVLNGGTPYIGSSAGTNVATPSIHTTNDMPITFPPTFDALGLVPFNINPHYIEPDNSSKHKGETRDERINEFIAYQKKPVLGLREGASLLVSDKKATLIGIKGARLFQPGSPPIEYEPDSDLSFLL